MRRLALEHAVSTTAPASHMPAGELEVADGLDGDVLVCVCTADDDDDAFAQYCFSRARLYVCMEEREWL